MRNYLIKDVSSLTGCSQTVLGDIAKLSALSIGHGVSEMVRNDDDCIEIDLGYGILSISFIDNEVHYKFSPNQFLENTVIESYQGNSPIIDVAIDTIKNRLMTSYKGLM